MTAELASVDSICVRDASQARHHAWEVLGACKLVSDSRVPSTLTELKHAATRVRIAHLGGYKGATAIASEVR